MKNLLISESINKVKEWLPLIAIEKFPVEIILIIISIQAGKIILNLITCKNNVRLKKMEYAHLERMKKMVVSENQNKHSRLVKIEAKKTI